LVVESPQTSEAHLALQHSLPLAHVQVINPVAAFEFGLGQLGRQPRFAGGDGQESFGGSGKEEVRLGEDEGKREEFEESEGCGLRSHGHVQDEGDLRAVIAVRQLDLEQVRGTVKEKDITSDLCSRFDSFEELLQGLGRQETDGQAMVLGLLRCVPHPIELSLDHQL